LIHFYKRYVTDIIIIIRKMFPWLRKSVHQI